MACTECIPQPIKPIRVLCEHQIALHFRDSLLHILQQPSALNLKGYKGTSAQRPFHLRAFTLLWRLLMSCAPLPKFIINVSLP